MVLGGPLYLHDCTLKVSLATLANGARTRFFHWLHTISFSVWVCWLNQTIYWSFFMISGSKLGIVFFTIIVLFYFKLCLAKTIIHKYLVGKCKFGHFFLVCWSLRKKSWFLGLVIFRLVAVWDAIFRWLVF